MTTFGDLVRQGLLAVGDGYRAKNKELGGDGPIFLRSAYLQNSGWILNGPDRFSQVSSGFFGVKIAQLGDTVLTTKGNSLGRLGFVSEEVAGAVYSPHLSYWRSLDINKIVPRYLYYWARSRSAQDQISARSESTDMAPYLSLADQLALRIDLPTWQRQQAIADVLVALDQKIDLNRRIAATLEAMARALFKSWFVDFDPVRAKAEGRPAGLPDDLAVLFPDMLVESHFGEIPEGWRLGTLGEIADHPRVGVRPAEIEPGTAYIALEHMPRRCIALSDWGAADALESNKFKFRAGDILFGKLRPYFHKVGIAPLDGICSTDIVVVRPKAEHWFGLVLALVSSDAFVEHANATSTGTKMPRTSWNDMALYRLALPPQALAQAFTNQVRPAIDRIVHSIHQSRTLAQLRDTLLPKLISGELRIANAETRIAADAAA